MNVEREDIHQPGTFRRARPYLGTLVAVEVQTEDGQHAERAFNAAYHAIAAVERLMHPTRAGGDLARLRDRSGPNPIEVHPWTAEVLRLSRELADQSNGLFDPCLPSAPGRIFDVHCTPLRQVTLSQHVHIDLGGIAKGYAVDRAVDALIAGGCKAGLVNAGGDVRVFGDISRTIVVRVQGGTHTLRLANAALAVSDPQAAHTPNEHRGYYRRNGNEDGVHLNFGAVVCAQTAALADGLAKCLLLADEKNGEALLEHFGASGRRIHRSSSFGLNDAS